MIEAVRDTALWTTAKVRGIRSLLHETVDRMRREAPRIYSRELAEIIFVQPCCRIHNLVDAGIAQRQSAAACLKTLAGIGILEERKAGRERLFINPPLLRLLTADQEG